MTMHDDEAPAQQPTKQAEESAIRGAFRTRNAATAASAGGAGQTDAASPLMRGAYLARLTVKQAGAVVGSEASGGAVMRGIYAARMTATSEAAIPRARGRVRRAAKAAPAKRAKAAKKRLPAKKAAAKPAKKAGRKPAAAAKPSRAQAKPRNKAGRKGRR